MTKVLQGIEKFKFLVDIVLLLAGLMFFSYVLNANVTSILKEQKRQSDVMATLSESLKDKGRDHIEFRNSTERTNVILDKMSNVLIKLDVTLTELNRKTNK